MNSWGPARAVQTWSAAAAALALIVLFSWNWLSHPPVRYPVVAIAIAGILLVGAAAGQILWTRSNRIKGIPEVRQLLSAIDAAQPNPSFHDGDWLKVTSNVMSLQLIITGLAGVLLIILVQFPGGPAPSPAPSGAASTTLPEWDAWPLVAAIAMSEAVYLAWLAEARAVADELILVSRRWARSRQTRHSTTISLSQTAALESSFVAHARDLHLALNRYGVDPGEALTTPDPN